MKKFLFTSVLAILFLGLNAQDIMVKEGTKSMREGSFNSFIIDLDEVEASSAEDGWESFMKEYKAKTKKDKKANLLVSENVQIPSLGKNPIDVYAMVNGEKGQKNSSVNIWFDTGSGYVNSIDMKTQAEAAKSIVEEYAVKVLKQSAEDNEKMEKKVLKDLEGDLSKLENKEESLRKNISKAQEDILKWEKELLQNEDDISSMKKKIRNQIDVAEEATEKAKKF